MKYLLVFTLALFLDKTFRSLQYSTFFIYASQCPRTENQEDRYNCIKDKQGIIHYLGTMSGTLVYDELTGWKWIY